LQSETVTEFPFKIVDKKRKPGLKAKAPITKVTLERAGDIFKAKAKDPEQMLYAIYGRVDGREMRLATFNKPQAEQISSKSKLALFKHRYHRFPAVGMRVDLVTNQNGFWQIAI
jgi:hypothetical protein